MKCRIAAAVAAIVTIAFVSGAHAQQVKPFFQGGFVVTDAEPTTTFIAPGSILPGNMRFIIQCIEFANDDQFPSLEITSTLNEPNGQETQRVYTSSVAEGSSAVFDTRLLAIKKSGGGSFAFCNWRAVELEQNRVQGIAVPWSLSPNGPPTPTLIAGFSEDTSFVLNVNRTSQSCTDGTFFAIVDGQPIEEPGGASPLLLSEGSSIIATGQTVAMLRQSGTCTNDGAFAGDIVIPLP